MEYKILAWTGTACSIAGAFLVAYGIMMPGYSAFLIGSSCWLVAGVYSDDRALITLNATFFVANVIGFSRNFHV